MTRLLLHIWQKITHWGLKDNMPHKMKRRGVQNNILGFLTVVSFHLFYIFIICIASGSKVYIYLSYVVIAFNGVIIYLLAKTSRSLLTKILAICNVYLGIAFFDIYLGSATGMFVYYIPFLFFTASFFSYRKEKTVLLIFFFLPIVVQLVNSLFLSNAYDHTILTSATVKIVRTFNFGFAFLLAAISGTFVLQVSAANDAKLFRSNLALQTLIDNTKASLWSVSKDLKIITANAQFKQKMKELFNETVDTGYDYSSIINHTNFPTQWHQHLSAVLQGRAISEEVNIYNEAYELQAAPIVKDAEVIGAVFYARNINDRKRNEEKIANTNIALEKALEAKEQFLSSMSHELRTPLNGILGITNLLHQEQHLTTQQQSLDMLKYTAEHMLDIVNDILDFNKIEAGKLALSYSPINMVDLLQKVCAFFESNASEKNITLHLDDTNITHKNVYADALRLRQVLNNLIGNAIKFTLRGKVIVRIQELHYNLTETTYKIAIEDTGIGIAHNKIDSIFSSFTQADARINRKFGGTGLGLTISDKLVRLMNSKIEVQSIHGVGSTFHFTITLANVHQVELQNNGTTELPPFERAVVLVAEDNKVNRNVIKRFLQKWNIDVVEAANGLEAVNMVKKTNFDVIFMDLEMPQMDGLKATTAIRQFNNEIPIIALTASTGENLKQSLLNAGMNDYVAKPFKPEELHNVIATYINCSIVD